MAVGREFVLWRAGVGYERQHSANLDTAGSLAIPNYDIGYDPTNDALITYTTSGGARALAFSATTGDFLASITLPGSIDAPYDWRMGCANNQLFIFNATSDSYQGFTITAVPEPASLGLMVVGLLSLAWLGRRHK